VFGEETTIHEDGRTYRERIAPGAFRGSLASNREVIANIDHQDATTFAKRSTGELLLQEDGHGLFASCWLPETRQGDDIVRRVESGEFPGASFAFRSLKDRWLGNDFVERESVELVDVCITATPYYPSTEVLLRHAKPQSVADYRWRKLRLLKLWTPA